MSGLSLGRVMCSPLVAQGPQARVLTALLMTGTVTRGSSRRRGAIDCIDAEQQGCRGAWRGQGDVNG